MIEKLEDRYLVIKKSDMESALTKERIVDLVKISDSITSWRRLVDRPILKGVVIEKDWPEYEPTVKALLDRINKNRFPVPTKDGLYWFRHKGNEECTVMMVMADSNFPTAVGIGNSIDHDLYELEGEWLGRVLYKNNKQ